MKVFSSQGKFNVFIIFLILAISSSLVGKLTSTYDKDILFKLVLTDLPKDKVVYDKSPGLRPPWKKRSWMQIRAEFLSGGHWGLS